jgi:predicted nuclease of predicted toxin-antitoxin system
MLATRLVLDENISPSLVDPLWERGVDTVHVRNRGMLGVADHVIWQYANAEARTIVTINRAHFMRLAKLSMLHPGVLGIPSGGTRDEQFEHIITAVTWAASANYPGSAFANRCVEVSVTLEITVEEITMLTQVSTKEQKYLC